MVIAFLMMHIIILPSVASRAGLIPSNTPCPKHLNRYQQTREWGCRYVFSNLELFSGGKVTFIAYHMFCKQDTPDDCKNFPRLSSQPPQQLVFALSAPDQTALSRLGEIFVSYVDGIDALKDARTDSILEQVAFTLSNRRSKFQWRTVVVAEQTEDLKRQLRDLEKPARASKPPAMLFCFTGQGAQWYAMGRELLAYEVYKTSLHNADGYLKSIGAPWSVSEELNMSKENSRIGKPEFAQPLCTVLQVAFVNLLRH